MGARSHAVDEEVFDPVQHEAATLAAPRTDVRILGKPSDRVRDLIGQ